MINLVHSIDVGLIPIVSLTCTPFWGYQLISSIRSVSPEVIRGNQQLFGSFIGVHHLTFTLNQAKVTPSPVIGGAWALSCSNVSTGEHFAKCSILVILTEVGRAV